MATQQRMSNSRLYQETYQMLGRRFAGLRVVGFRNDPFSV